MPDTLQIGRHTRAIADRLTQAVNDYLNGISTFLVFSVPFRHGKSDLTSRSFPAFFLGRCRERQPDVMMSGYGATLVEGFSRKVQRIIASPAYQQVFPGIVARGSSSEWAIDGSAGVVAAAGLGGGLTGKGGSLIILDDYCKNREEAESITYRDATWESFRNDLMTRRAPVSIVCVTATRWHEDDVIGRIQAEMAKNPDFPRFEFHVFPATDPKTGERLFPDRFSEAWYREQYATLGPYSAAALLDCDPRPKGEQRFDQAWFRYYSVLGIPALPDGYPIDLIVDYAGSQRDEACESVILERSRGPMPDELGQKADYRYYDRLTHGRMGAALLKQTIIDRIQKRRAEGRPVRLGLEQGAAIVLRAWLEEELQKNNLRVPIYDLKSAPGTGSPSNQPGMAKLRIENLVAPYAAGQIIHNDQAGSEQVWNGERFLALSMRGGELERQLLSYPSKPDDCADAAAYSEQGVMDSAGRQVKPPKDITPWWAKPVGQTVLRNARVRKV